MAQHSYRTIPAKEDERVYRCKVVTDTDGSLLIGNRYVRVNVRETFGTGFTIGVTPRLAKKIKTGKRYELRHADRRVLVVADSPPEPVQGEHQVIVEVVHEYQPKERWAFRLPFMKGSKVISHDSGINSSTAYGGFVIVLFLVMSLPGIGDRLGTAPRIESAVKLLGRNVVEVVGSFHN